MRCVYLVPKSDTYYQRLTILLDVIGKVFQSFSEGKRLEIVVTEEGHIDRGF